MTVTRKATIRMRIKPRVPKMKGETLGEQLLGCEAVSRMRINKGGTPPLVRAGPEEGTPPRPRPRPCPLSSLLPVLIEPPLCSHHMSLSTPASQIGVISCLPCGATTRRKQRGGSTRETFNCWWSLPLGGATNAPTSKVAKKTSDAFRPAVRRGTGTQASVGSLCFCVWWCHLRVPASTTWFHFASSGRWTPQTTLSCS